MGSAPLQYDWPEGRRPLRELVAAELRSRGADVEPEEVVITNGAQDAIGIVIDVLAPSTVQIDPETYAGALDVFRSRGCAVGTTGAALRYAMPALSNPSGRAATRAERDAMLDARWVLEDDAYAHLDFRGPAATPLLAESRRHVFHVGTYSKVLSPGLRVGWLVPPRAWLGRVRGTKLQRDLHASGLAQTVVERVLVETDFSARLIELRAAYARRRDRLLTALTDLPGLHYEVPVGGFSVWVETDLHLDDADALRIALDAGVSFDPGCLFRAEQRRDPPLAMRLSYSAIDEDRIEEGAARLGRALENMQRAERAAPRCHLTTVH
jgi:2-aminoadipate transaminase